MIAFSHHQRRPPSAFVSRHLTTDSSTRRPGRWFTVSKDNGRPIKLGPLRWLSERDGLDDPTIRKYMLSVGRTTHWLTPGALFNGPQHEDFARKLSQAGTPLAPMSREEWKTILGALLRDATNRQLAIEDFIDSVSWEDLDRAAYGTESIAPPMKRPRSHRSWEELGRATRTGEHVRNEASEVVSDGKQH